jgi:hypothetical protein
MATASAQLGPRVHPPFLVRFGIWIVVGTLAAMTVVAALVSYPDEVRLPVHPVRQLPLRVGTIEGRVHFHVQDGAMVRAHDLIATVEIETGNPAAVLRIPAPFGRQLRVGQQVVYETPGKRTGLARVEAILPSGNAIEVRLALPNDGGPGYLTVDGKPRSVLTRLLGGLWTR